MLISRIKAVATPGTRIPKPKSNGIYVVLGWTVSRGEEALVYRIPKRPGTKRASQKRIPVSAFEEAFAELTKSGTLTRRWFRASFPVLDHDGGCNFTTIGGVFELLGEARFVQSGVYAVVRSAANSDSRTGTA
jgi:hypothetical protein